MLPFDFFLLNFSLNLKSKSNFTLPSIYGSVFDLKKNLLKKWSKKLLIEKLRIIGVKLNSLTNGNEFCWQSVSHLKLLLLKVSISEAIEVWSRDLFCWLINDMTAYNHGLDSTFQQHMNYLLLRYIREEEKQTQHIKSNFTKTQKPSFLMMWAFPKQTYNQTIGTGIQSGNRITKNCVCLLKICY